MRKILEFKKLNGDARLSTGVFYKLKPKSSAIIRGPLHATLLGDTRIFGVACTGLIALDEGEIELHCGPRPGAIWVHHSKAARASGGGVVEVADPIKDEDVEMESFLKLAQRFGLVPATATTEDFEDEEDPDDDWTEEPWMPFDEDIDFEEEPLPAPQDDLEPMAEGDPDEPETEPEERPEASDEADMDSEPSITHT